MGIRHLHAHQLHAAGGRDGHEAQSAYREPIRPAVLKNDRLLDGWGKSWECLRTVCGVFSLRALRVCSLCGMVAASLWISFAAASVALR